jgi:hypothetical protein
MAANTYRVNPNRESLDKQFGVGTYTVAVKGKKKARRWVVSKKGPAAPKPVDPNAPDPNDPFGINKMAKPQLDRLDRYSAAHQQWAGDVRKWTESSLQNIYNAREASNNAYAARLGSGGAAVGNNGNAPVVSGSSGGTGGVADPNQAITNANANYTRDMNQAQVALANLSGRTDNANQLNFMAQQLKSYDYYASQLPALYNEAKQKYTASLTSAVMDLEGKKEIANIKADASMYGAQQRLLGSLAGVQGAGDRAQLAATTSLTNNNNDNATTVATTDANNRARIQVAGMNQQTALARIRQQGVNASRKSSLARSQWEKKQWDSFFNGTPAVVQPSGLKLFYDPNNDGKLAKGAVAPGSELLTHSDPNKQIAGLKNWLHIAVHQLHMTPRKAANYAFAYLTGPPAQKRKVLAAAGFGAGLR